MLWNSKDDFKSPIPCVVSDQLDIYYEYKKVPWWKNVLFNAYGQKLKNNHINIFHIKNKPSISSENVLFSYTHVIYFLSSHLLKDGWNIITYGKKKAIITKGSTIFLEVEGFKNLKELYQYLYRFEFDETTSFQLIENTDSAIINIEKALKSSRFIHQFNLNKKLPFMEITTALLLLFLFVQTTPNFKTSYPQDQFFKTINYLEEKLGGQEKVKMIESKKGKLTIILSKDTPQNIIKRMPYHDVIIHQN